MLLCLTLALSLRLFAAKSRLSCAQFDIQPECSRTFQNMFLETIFVNSSKLFLFLACKVVIVSFAFFAAKLQLQKHLLHCLLRHKKQALSHHTMVPSSILKSLSKGPSYRTEAKNFNLRVRTYSTVRLYYCHMSVSTN